MSSEREAVERLTWWLSSPGAVMTGGWMAGGVISAADLRLILTDYARLQSESAKDGEALISGINQIANRCIRPVSRSEIRAMCEALTRKATPPAGSTQIGEG